MKISIAQIEPIKGDINRNIRKHIAFINKAILNKAEVIIFPELSLTGYEPKLAKKLKTTAFDARLDVFQDLSDNNNIIIGVGLPAENNDKIFISMIIFQPNKERITYSKQYLYPTEYGVFTAGEIPLVISIDKDNILAPAICYELSNEEHQKYAYKNGATIYIASVLNSVNGVDADIEKLSTIAYKYRMTTLMANFVGLSGGYECAGKSSIWDNQGSLIAQLDKSTEGLLIYDTKLNEVIRIIVLETDISEIIEEFNQKKTFI